MTNTGLSPACNMSWYYHLSFLYLSNKSGKSATNFSLKSFIITFCFPWNDMYKIPVFLQHAWIRESEGDRASGLQSDPPVKQMLLKQTRRETINIPYQRTCCVTATQTPALTTKEYIQSLLLCHHYMEAKFVWLWSRPDREGQNWDWPQPRFLSG